jgi:serine/threonine protein kinase
MEIAYGAVIMNYTFLDRISQGAYCIVYKVLSSKFGMEFAAKVLPPDPDESQRSQRAAEAELDVLMQLNHPNIILIYDHFLYNKFRVLILEYCPNASLCEEVEATHGLDLDRFTSIASQLLSALEYIHSQGISHRDIKPGNILIDQYRRPKLADFGISARGVDDDRAGTSSFLAPEVVQRKSTDRCKADVWALGVTFGYMIEGNLPWPEGAMYHAILHGNYIITRTIPHSLSDLLKHMFSVNPESRWSATDLRNHPFFAAGEKGAHIQGTQSLLPTRSKLFKPQLHSSISQHLPMNTASRSVLPHSSSKSALLIFAGSKMARKDPRRSSSDLNTASLSFSDLPDGEIAEALRANEIEND